MIEQGHSFSGQELPDRDPQLLTPAIPAAGAVGEMLAMGHQPLVQMAGEQRDAVEAEMVPEDMASHADLAAAAGAKHVLIEPGPVLSLIHI